MNCGILPNTEAPSFYLAALRLGEILEGFSKKVVCKLILEDKRKEIHLTKKNVIGTEEHLWQCE